MGNVEDKDIDNKAKGLGTKYYGVYQAGIAKHGDRRLALADAIDAKSQAEMMSRGGGGSGGGGGGSQAGDAGKPSTWSEYVSATKELSNIDAEIAKYNNGIQVKTGDKAKDAVYTASVGYFNNDWAKPMGQTPVVRFTDAKGNAFYYNGKYVYALKNGTVVKGNTQAPAAVIQARSEFIQLEQRRKSQQNIVKQLNDTSQRTKVNSDFDNYF
jgi:hypothetical protein